MSELPKEAADMIGMTQERRDAIEGHRRYHVERDATIAQLRNDLQAAQCAEKMSADIARDLRARLKLAVEIMTKVQRRLVELDVAHLESHDLYKALIQIGDIP